MAQVDKFANTLLDANSRAIKQNLFALYGQGMAVHAFFSRVEIAAADDANSEYILWRDLNANLVPLILAIGTDGITGLTDANVGIFGPSTADGQTPGAVIDDNCFADALDLSSGVASLNPKTALDGLVTVALDNYYKTLYEHAGHTVSTKKGAYGIGITAIADPGGAGGVHAMLLAATAC